MNQNHYRHLLMMSALGSIFVLMSQSAPIWSHGV